MVEGRRRGPPRRRGPLLLPGRQGCSGWRRARPGLGDREKKRFTFHYKNSSSTIKQKLWKHQKLVSATTTAEHHHLQQQQQHISNNKNNSKIVAINNSNRSMQRPKNKSRIFLFTRVLRPGDVDLQPVVQILPSLRLPPDPGPVADPLPLAVVAPVDGGGDVVPDAGVPGGCGS